MSSAPGDPNLPASHDTTDVGRLLALTLPPPLGADVLLVNRFAASEQISRMFSFDLELMTELAKTHLVSADGLIGKPVSIRLTLSDGSPRFFHGIVSRFVEAEQDRRFRYYQLQVAPWLWLLTLTSDCRIFQGKRVPEIVKEIFAKHGFTEGKGLRDGLARPRTDYTRWDYCVQYRETDYNFVSRMMEQEGIFYFFEHEKQKDTLVLFDTLEKCKPSPRLSEPLRFAPEDVGMGDWGEVMSSWQKVQTLAPGKCTLRDHHFVVPKATLEASQPTLEEFAIGGNSALEVYDFPGEYAQKFYDSSRVLETPSPLFEEASRVASLRIQEEETPHEIFTGSSDCRGLEVGCSFDLIGHSSMNGKYVVTALQHSVAQDPPHVTGRNLDLPYSNMMRCLLFGRSFRPARITLRPVVQGPQTAVVVGKSGDEILVDNYGRVKVQFFWDRNGKQDENSSCWLRVAQLWAGSGWGAIFIPRVGQEVIVDFLEGDPDQPIVIGSLYNADQMPPYALPGHQTRSTIQSRSSKGGGTSNYNEIRFEDLKGSEQIFIKAEKDMDERVQAESREYVGANRHLIVSASQLELVGGDKHGRVKGKHFEEIEGDMHLGVVGNQKVSVDGDSSFFVEGNQKEAVGGKMSLTVGQDEVCQINGNVSLVCQSQNEQVATTHALEAGQTIHLKAGMTVIIEAGTQLSLKGPGGFVDIGPAGVTIQGTTVLINSGGAAGSGPGASTQSPDQPDLPTDPKGPDTADDGSKGGKLNQ
jgi:type VI secretion system secreted protein VgrG